MAGAAFWERGPPTKLAMGCQKLCGSNKYWKKRYGYHKRSLSETAIIKALNKFTGLGMPETYRIDEETHKMGDSISKLNYATKPPRKTPQSVTKKWPPIFGHDFK
ncbi:hypothetical protein M892_05600 [Vibrio campbellii ATCC BAA-1116]|uniref:Uncharacterized protein n=1 Tax=Vibrio campbellii (strain ATCC BAA-1116) TaxID=2902295 RepID=A7MV43_VIBC1|nr:hypothetical protein VIBHAR_01501 [Vibrio campbellii ATCC BAA-1116]AGU96397.1 hypothetical protein M892_05600 [Vibrio campbellii ATCC BAA-1116]